MLTFIDCNAQRSFISVYSVYIGGS